MASSPRVGDDNADDSDATCDVPAAFGHVGSGEDHLSSLAALTDADDQDTSIYSQQLEAMSDMSKYDPNQSIDERLLVRNTYSHLIKEIEAEKERTLTSASLPKALEELLEKADQIHSSSVKTTFDATMDSKLLKVSAEAGLSSMKKLDIVGRAQFPFNLSSLSSKLDEFFKDNRALSLLGKAACSFGKTAYFVDFMYKKTHANKHTYTYGALCHVYIPRFIGHRLAFCFVSFFL